MTTMNSETFGSQTPQNEIDWKLLHRAYAEFQECVQRSINEGDVAIVLADFDGEVQKEELDRIATDVAERVQAAADPGRNGYAMDDISFDLDDLYSEAKEKMYDHIIAAVLNHRWGHEDRRFIPAKGGDPNFRIEGRDKGVPGHPEAPGAFAVQITPKEEDLSDNAGYFGHTIEAMGDQWKIIWLW